MGVRKYLGDGVYMEVYAQGGLVNGMRIYTSDGANETNEIYLEPDMPLQMVEYMEAAKKAGA